MKEMDEGDARRLRPMNLSGRKGLQNRARRTLPQIRRRQTWKGEKKRGADFGKIPQS
ncbi:hypothetical protein B4135_3217 [Caldibacillus debilis]|uniref:Uncharacterized protein n=1 Tax=Caldibacillus debilis TaxID=301148 RepID=A0A150LGW8_9BACI|nr:hypothetical protein B4135_3217 [Caldibacillus debilis]